MMKNKAFGVNEIYATGHNCENGYFYIDMNVQSSTNRKNEDILLILDKHQIKQINNVHHYYSIQDINNWIMNNEEKINKTYKLYLKDEKNKDKSKLSLLAFSLMTFSQLHNLKNNL
jgi:hypothetical protein